MKLIFMHASGTAYKTYIFEWHAFVAFLFRQGWISRCSLKQYLCKRFCIVTKCNFLPLQSLEAWRSSTELLLWLRPTFRSLFKMSPQCRECWSMLKHRYLCFLLPAQMISCQKGRGAEISAETAAALHWPAGEGHRRAAQAACRRTG